ncbi:MAG TPA: serine hydrolase domain-containing protein, partial [Puia sp.]|nr:serine hydrolase domain-containing protein [Puia sp.]
MKRIFATLCIYFAFLIAPDAQTFHPSISAGTPVQTGMSSERLGRIDSVLQRSIRDNWTNAAVALVIRNGKIAYYKSFGYNNMEKKSPMPKDDIFRIASQTKAITSVAIMMLYEEGKIMLDDPV